MINDLQLNQRHLSQSINTTCLPAVTNAGSYSSFLQMSLLVSNVFDLAILLR